MKLFGLIRLNMADGHDYNAPSQLRVLRKTVPEVLLMARPLAQFCSKRTDQGRKIRFFFLFYWYFLLERLNVSVRSHFQEGRSLDC